MMTKTLLLLTIISIALASQAIAKPTIECHCFQDRTFSANEPAKVDPYLLATSQNSFLAEVFRIERRGIVQAKMQGVDAELLWISNYLVSVTDKSDQEVGLLLNRGLRGTDLVTELKLNPEELSPSIWLALLKGEKGATARAIVDDAISKRLGFTAQDIAHLRKSGAINKELILSAIIARRTNSPLTEVYATKTSNNSWGFIADTAGIIPMDIDDLIKSIILPK